MTPNQNVKALTVITHAKSCNVNKNKHQTAITTTHTIDMHAKMCAVDISAALYKPKLYTIHSSGEKQSNTCARDMTPHFHKHLYVHTNVMTTFTYGKYTEACTA